MGCGIFKPDNVLHPNTQASNNTSDDETITIHPSMFIVQRSEDDISLHYEIISPPMASGAFGSVHKALYRVNNELRAVKIILKDMTNPKAVETWMNEIKLTASLNHPNTVRIYDFFEDDKKFYIASELCEGGDLMKLLQEREAFTEVETALLMRELFYALKYLHSRNITHRDLKPDNLLLDTKENLFGIKVADFGFATKVQSMELLKTKLGTLNYMAPEIFDGSYDAKCDIWSSGVIAYVLMGGNLPFDGEHAREVIDRIRKGEVNFEGERWKSVSYTAKQFIKDLLVMDPKKRLSADEALNHSWLASYRVQASEVKAIADKESISYFLNYRDKDKLMQTAYVFISWYLLPKKDKQILERTFKVLDDDCDGFISKKEFKKALGNAEITTTPDNIDKAFEAADINGNGKIDFYEFVVAAMNKRKSLTRHHVGTTFQRFDYNNNGSITAPELAKIIRVAPNDPSLDKIIADCKPKVAGQISLEDFRAFVARHAGLSTA